MNPEKEIGYTLGGLAAVEAGPKIVEEAFKNWGVDHEAVVNTPLGKGIENATGFVQNIAPPLAAMFVVWTGFKTMFKGLEGDKGRKRSGFAS